VTAHGWTEIPGPGPIGRLYVAGSETGVLEVERAGDPGGFELLLSTRHGRAVPWSDELPEALARPVERALAGEPALDLPVDLDGRTPFEAAVIRATRTIPRGEVRPYAWLAREAGRPRAVRAAAGVMAGNVLPFVVPCHRVVRADGHIGAYGPGGPATKRALLRLEGLDPDALDALADAGIRYLGDPTTERFCFPTCRRLDPVPEADRVALRSGDAAVAAGWRACPTCRPLTGSPYRD
jgi:O-6-methylguanine DNA methyltransferase